MLVLVGPLTLVGALALVELWSGSYFLVKLLAPSLDVD